MFTTRSQRSSRSGKAAHLAVHGALLLFLLLSLTLAAPALAASDVAGTAWLSGPAALWSSVWGGSDTSTAATQLKSAIQSDFAAAITALDSGAGVTVSTLSPNTAPASGPAYGTETTYTITSTTLTAAEIAACLRSATLTNLNTLFSTFASSLSLTITVLNADTPADVTQIVSGYLPVTGASYIWQVVVDILSAAGSVAQAGFVIPIENDLQTIIDSTGKLYLVVVPTATSASIINASALYVGYSVWAYPTTTSPAAASILEATAMTTPLTNFNAFVSGLSTSYTALSAYSDLIPSSVKTSTPLVYNPYASSSSSGDVVVVVGNVSGNYLLTFNGSANTWGRLWTLQRSTISATIVAAAEAELTRRDYVTSVEVVAASTVPNEKKYVGGLQVVCYVAHGYAVNASHVWSPEEIASMLLQGDYTATQALYTAAAAAGTGSVLARAFATGAVTTSATSRSAGALATTGIQYDYSAKMLSYEVGMIIMAAVIGFLCILAFFIACGCCCCCRHCISTERQTPATTSEWEADLDRYQRGMMNQDEAFAEAENPNAAVEQRHHHKHKKAHAVDGTHDRSVSPNPLQTPDAQLLYSPREGDAEGLRQLKQASPPPRNTPSPTGNLYGSDNSDLVKKPAPAAVHTAQGVPLEAHPTPAEDRPYAQYYDATPEKTAQPMAVAASTTAGAGAAAVVAATAPPPEEDERTGSDGKRHTYRRSVSFTDDPRARQAAHHLVTPPPPKTTPPTPRDPENGTGYVPQYMANVTPTPFFNPQDSVAAPMDNDAMNQTRLSQGSQGSTPTPAPPLPPPAYPHYESPRRHQYHGAHSTPPAYPMQEQNSPAYTPLPPTTAPAYPSPDLYAGAPAPPVTSSLGSFSPMPTSRY